MNGSRLPVEVELVYEVMPCNAMRTAQEPGRVPHPCAYFRAWGTYHSYDYSLEGAPARPGILHEAHYLGRAPLVPEVLSGCRKAPIIAIGINPNLPGWWSRTRRSLNPVFDDYKQYAHYFRYRSIAKLELSESDYIRYGGGPHDTPFSDFELQVPRDEQGRRPISVQLQPQRMYEVYRGLLIALAEEMGWQDHQLTVGEDLAYGNMVHCPSAKWTTLPSPSDPALPPMTIEQRDGIVRECFRERQYFVRQLFQSLPAVILIFSQSTANAFIAELGARMTAGAPRAGEPLEELAKREIRITYGALPDGTAVDGRVIFAPHITGDPRDFAAARAGVVKHMVDEARAGRVGLNPSTGHLNRPVGACVFCPMLGIGPCDYADELRPLTDSPAIGPDGPVASLRAERARQEDLRADLPDPEIPVAIAWAGTDDGNEDPDLRSR